MTNHSITKTNQNILLLVEAMPQWADVEVTYHIDPDVMENIKRLQNDMLAVQTFLAQVHAPLRQNGGADVSHVEVPKCVAVSSTKSPKPSKKRASSSSTKRKATSSGSPSTEATSAKTAEPEPEA